LLELWWLLGCRGLCGSGSELWLRGRFGLRRSGCGSCRRPELRMCGCCEWLLGCPELWLCGCHELWLRIELWLQ
jgi:hypothetical protein